MLTRPDITDDQIIACLRDNFRLEVARLTFLPIGADVNSAAFRIDGFDGSPYFLKLRRGPLNVAAVAVPAFLRTRGIRRVMAPIPTAAGELSASVGGFNLMLYPYFAGTNCFETTLSKEQLIALGETMKAIHASPLSADLLARVPRETFGPRFRRVVRAFHREVERTVYDDPVAARFAAFWGSKRGEIETIVDRAERLAEEISSRTVEMCLCHGDLHGGNVLVAVSGELSIVDWDDPILAPKERDLMFVGGGVGGVWNQESDVRWFYVGYGEASPDPNRLAYYRYERIVEDLAAYAEEILHGRAGPDDRERGLRQQMSQFQPGGVVEIAHRTWPYPDRSAPVSGGGRAPAREGGRRPRRGRRRSFRAEATYG